MTHLTHVLLVALMALGLAYTLARLVGPFGLAMALRGWVLNLSLPAWMKDGVLCVYCWSFWLTLGSTVFVLQVDITGIGGSLDLGTICVVWLAAYGLTVLVFLLAGL